MLRRPLATLLLALCLGAALTPAVAGAQSNPFSPLPVAPQDTQTEASSPSPADDVNDGLERWQEILIFVGGVGLILGIGWAILHDARRVAPVSDDRELYGEPERKPGTRTPAEQRKAQARKRAKAQRQARKHNR